MCFRPRYSLLKAFVLGSRFLPDALRRAFAYSLLRVLALGYSFLLDLAGKVFLCGLRFLLDSLRKGFRPLLRVFVYGERFLLETIGNSLFRVFVLAIHSWGPSSWIKASCGIHSEKFRLQSWIPADFFL